MRISAIASCLYSIGLKWGFNYGCIIQQRFANVSLSYRDATKCISKFINGLTRKLCARCYFVDINCNGSTTVYEPALLWELPIVCWLAFCIHITNDCRYKCMYMHACCVTASVNFAILEMEIRALTGGNSDKLTSLFVL